MEREDQEKKYVVGQRVVLRGAFPGVASGGSLNSIFLHEEGGLDRQGVPITKITPYGYIVTLPRNNCPLPITDFDIDQISTRNLGSDSLAFKAPSP